MSSRFATEEQLKRVVDFKGAREYHLQKGRSKKDKRMSLPEAISEYVHDGDIMCESGFGYVRSPLQAYHEIIRQRKKDLVGMGAPMTNFSYLMTLGCVNGIHMSYMGVEMRGNDKNYGRLIKANPDRILSQWSHGTMALGLKAAQMGVPFVASKQMLGSDMIEKNPYIKIINNPLEDDEDPVCLIPALFPDFCVIHVQEADRYGNAVIKGPAVCDIALAAASRRVIITAERIVPEMKIRDEGTASIPFWYVDAVVDLPYGALPGSCPGCYYWAREWWEWLIRVATPRPESVTDFMNYWMYDCKDQYDFIDKLGGIRYLDHIRQLMQAAEADLDDSLTDFSYQEVIPKWEPEGGIA